MTTYAWGNNNAQGLLGIGNVSLGAAVYQPQPVIGDFIQASSNGQTTLFLKADGTVWWAGSNANGAAGNNAGGGDNAVHHTPTQVPFISNVKRVACGNTTYWALTNQGYLYVWGRVNYGEIGDGIASEFIASAYFRLANVLDFAVATSTMVVLTTGVVQAAGDNSYGQLGDGTTTQRSSWVTVTPASGTPKAVRACSETTNSNAHLLLMADGSVLGCGYNADYQIGTPNSLTNSSWASVPVLPSGAASGISANAGGVFGQDSLGHWYGRGYYFDGRLGIHNAVSDVTAPTQLTESELPAGQVFSHLDNADPSATGLTALDAAGTVYVCGDPALLSGAARSDFLFARYGTAFSGMTWVNSGNSVAFCGGGSFRLSKARSFATII